MDLSFCYVKFNNIENQSSLMPNPLCAVFDDIAKNKTPSIPAPSRFHQ